MAYNPRSWRKTERELDRLAALPAPTLAPTPTIGSAPTAPGAPIFPTYNASIGGNGVFNQTGALTPRIPTSLPPVTDAFTSNLTGGGSMSANNIGIGTPQSGQITPWEPDSEFYTRKLENFLNIVPTQVSPGVGMGGGMPVPAGFPTGLPAYGGGGGFGAMAGGAGGAAPLQAPTQRTRVYGPSFALPRYTGRNT